MKKLSYKISNLYLSNFKAFVKKDIPININFNEKNKLIDFMLLAGPNGYGKTSIFQAIELALLGKIEIPDIKDNTKIFNENPICNMVGEDSLIALELIDNFNNYISIIRYNPKVIGDKVDICSDKFKLYIINEKFDYKIFKEQLPKLKENNEKELEDILGNINKKFWLYYIKQDQNSNFIFKKNSDRVGLINTIVNERKNISTSFVNDKIEEIDLELEKVKSYLEEIKSKYNKTINKSIGQCPEPIKVFKEEDFIWDKLKYELDEDLNSYKSLVEKLLDIVMKYEEYYQLDRRINIKMLLEDHKLIRDMIVHEKYNQQYEKFVEVEKEISILKEVLLQDVLNTNNNIERHILDKSLNSEVKLNIELLINLKRKLKKISNIRDVIYEKIKATRDISIKNKEEFEDLFNLNCPLCGTEFDSSKNLMDAINDFSHKFSLVSEYIGDEVKELQNEIEEIYEKINKRMYELKESEYFNPKVLAILKNFRENNYLESINEKIKLFNLTFKTELRKIIFEVDLDLKKENDFENKIINYIKNKIDSEYCENTDVLYYKEYKKYHSYINNREECLELLKFKSKELDWYINKRELENNSVLFNEHVKNKEKYNELQVTKIKLSKIRNAIDNAEKRYKEDIIKYIKIPLYIYSGKLLQTHQNGLGVFCETGPSKNKLTKIKFITESGSDQDLVTKFSSGQLSILTIASLLAFRKITETKLNLLMIDDPCQTMDELNIASMTEILRNEFSNEQVIISTHEDNIAGYMAYKYYKSSKNYRYYNVKDELYKIKG